MGQPKIGDSRVVESREVGDGVTIRRRRESPDGSRFTTYERIEKPNLAVIKKDGARELFDRDKLATAIKRSVGKFFSSEVEIEEMILSRQIGDKVLDELATRNEVAYVRFASVYHEFKTLEDFVRILEHRKNQKKAA